MLRIYSSKSHVYCGGSSWPMWKSGWTGVLANCVERSTKYRTRPLMYVDQNLNCFNNVQTRTIFIFSKEKELDRDFITKLQNPQEITLEAIRRRAKLRKEMEIMDNQRFVDLRYKVLGADLATAHFVIARGGAVKLVGHDKWYIKDEDGKVPLPGRRTPNMFLEAIDVKGMNLMFHGLENFKDLEHLKYLNLSDCPNIDDWCLDRLIWFRKSLVYLDISRCPKITERGLPALHKLQELRRLNMAGMTGIKHKPLAAIMLEEAMPNCSIEGIDYTDKSELNQIQALTDSEADLMFKGLTSSTEHEEQSNQGSAENPPVLSKLKQFFNIKL